MRIANLLDEIGEQAEITSIRDACSDILTDYPFLVMKKITNDAKWKRAYQETIGIAPSVQILQNRAERAIQRTEELLRSGTLISCALPTYELLIPKTRELLRRLREYKDSIPSYFEL